MVIGISLLVLLPSYVAVGEHGRFGVVVGQARAQGCHGPAAAAARASLKPRAARTSLMPRAARTRGLNVPARLTLWAQRLAAK